MKIRVQEVLKCHPLEEIFINAANTDTKCMAYTNLVRPALEYTSSVWDPYLNRAIEIVQRCTWAARWVKSDYL